MQRRVAGGRDELDGGASPSAPASGCRKATSVFWLGDVLARAGGEAEQAGQVCAGCVSVADGDGDVIDVA